MRSSMLARRAGGAAVVLVFALTLAACGGSSKTTSATTTTPTTVAGRGAAAAAFESCLKSHLPAGVTLPTRGFGGAFRGAGGGGAGNAGNGGSIPTTTLPAGVTSAQWQAALKACASQLPRGGGANNPQFAAYRNCLNAYLSANGGTTLPSTGGGGLGGGGFGGGASGETTTTNPLLQAAQAHCAALRPSFGSTTTSTTA